MSTGTEKLQLYMDELRPALNTALNQLAKDRPEQPLKALAKLLDPEAASAMPALAKKTVVAVANDDPVYTASQELRELMGQTGRERAHPLRAQEVVHELIRAGALTLLPDDMVDAETTMAPAPALASAPSSAPSVAIKEGSAPARARALWQRALKPALQRVKAHDNAWAAFEIHKRPTELCRRWDYDAARDVWECSETLIKMEGEPFAKGAMRECYRMKKMSQVNAHFFFHMAWEDCNNYVAKRYMKEEEGGEANNAQAYFDDIKMQMVSKRYARLYNALQPPKGVDFLQAWVMEVDRGGKTLTFAVERAMEEEGAFVKYNNNSGFVDYGIADPSGVHAHRLTPHAFSRFTFDRSAGNLMVVDIQVPDTCALFRALVHFSLAHFSPCSGARGYVCLLTAQSCAPPAGLRRRVH